MSRLREAVSKDSFIQYCKGAACEFSINRQAEIEKHGTPLPKNGRIDFSEEGNALEYTIIGFSSPHMDDTWTVGRRAALKISGLPRAPLFGRRVKICATSHIASLHPVSFTIDVNGVEVASETINRSDRNIYVVRIPRFPKEPLELGFNIANPISPKSLGINEDTRELGIAMHWIEFA